MFSASFNYKSIYSKCYDIKGGISEHSDLCLFETIPDTHKQLKFSCMAVPKCIIKVLLVKYTIHIFMFGLLFLRF